MQGRWKTAATEERSQPFSFSPARGGRRAGLSGIFSYSAAGRAAAGSESAVPEIAAVSAGMSATALFAGAFTGLSDDGSGVATEVAADRPVRSKNDV